MLQTTIIRIITLHEYKAIHYVRTNETSIKAENKRLLFKAPIFVAMPADFFFTNRLFFIRVAFQ